LINFCSFSTMIINDFCKWAWIFKVVMAMYISKFDVFFGVMHVEFYFKAWTLCLMCIVALFYNNPRFEF
jgi:hypothetical protein